MGSGNLRSTWVPSSLCQEQDFTVMGHIDVDTAHWKWSSLKALETFQFHIHIFANRGWRAWPCNCCSLSHPLPRNPSPGANIWVPVSFRGITHPLPQAGSSVMWAREGKCVLGGKSHGAPIPIRIAHYLCVQLVPKVLKEKDRSLVFGVRHPWMRWNLALSPVNLRVGNIYWIFLPFSYL
jgi:hypothetical protein